MASEQHDTVFHHDLEDDDNDDDESSQSQDDDDDLENVDAVMIGENDGALPDVEDDDDEEEEDINSVSSPPVTVPIAVPSSSLVTIAVPNGVPNAPSLSLESSPPDAKRQRVDSTATPMTVVIHNHQEKKPQPQAMDESRRLFQRLWTDEDEIELLRGFLEYTTQRGTNHPDTALFYDQIKSKLQLDFNKNQLVEKLRRLKKKYRNVLNKISSGKDFCFKTAHDQATFEISRKIWSSTGKLCVEDANLDEDDANPNPNPTDGDVKIEDHNNNNNNKSTPKSRKRSRPRSSGGGAGGSVKIEDKQTEGFVVNNNDVNNSNNNSNSNANVSSLIEETVKSCLSPLFKELLSNAMTFSGRGIGGLAMNAMPLSFGSSEMMVDDKWRKQQIMELEVYSKRLELVQDQIRAQLEELRSMGG